MNQEQATTRCCENPRPYALRRTDGPVQKNEDGTFFRAIKTIGFECASCKHREMLDSVDT